MEPYSADKIKRKKRKQNNLEEDILPPPNLVIPFKVAFTNIYDGNEKIPFKERDPQYQAILRDEFE